MISRTPEADLNEDWFQLRLDALMARKLGPEMRTLLAKPGQPLPPLLREVYRYRLARAENAADDLLQQHRKDLISAAESGAAMPVVMDAAAVMERYQDFDTAVRLYERAANDERNGLSARLAIVRCLNATPADSAAPLMAALEAALKLWPHLDEARNDLIYLKLIEGTADDIDMKAAAAFAEAYPWILAYRMTAALSLFRAGDAIAALSLLERERLPWEQVQPGWQAIYGALLAANYRKDEARAVAVRILGARLRPGESKLFRQYVPETP